MSTYPLALRSVCAAYAFAVSLGAIFYVCHLCSFMCYPLLCSLWIRVLKPKNGESTGTLVQTAESQCRAGGRRPHRPGTAVGGAASLASRRVSGERARPSARDPRAASDPTATRASDPRNAQVFCCSLFAPWHSYSTYTVYLHGSPHTTDLVTRYGYFLRYYLLICYLCLPYSNDYPVPAPTPKRDSAARYRL